MSRAVLHEDAPELLVVDVAAGPEAGHLAVPIVLGLEEVANDAPILHAEPELIAELRDGLVQPRVDLVVLRVRVRRLLDAPLHLGGALLRALLGLAFLGTRVTSSRNALSSAGLPPATGPPRLAAPSGAASAASRARGARDSSPAIRSSRSAICMRSSTIASDSSPVSARIAVCSTRAGPSRSDGAEGAAAGRATRSATTPESRQDPITVRTAVRMERVCTVQRRSGITGAPEPRRGA